MLLIRCQHYSNIRVRFCTVLDDIEISNIYSYSIMIFCVFTFVAKGPPLHYPPRSSILFAFREVPNMVFGYVQMLHEAGAGSGCGNAEAKGRSGACSGPGPCAILEICIPGPPSGLDWWGWFEYNWICHNMSHSESFCELCVIKRSLLSTKGHCEPIAQHVSKQNAPRIQDKVSSWF